eukprot:CAMPEP_0202757124 /NCGR_PEP_ID=MMETSP1388-20130828/16168_1 /ASSEMBLY_ACC=CAM_ASM_000864 /TAXON_ID=37098 /ORGANISM="Isochrysis sp, Strain CCMP1244" /LENGTH=67 /DNA_ID=CAMNT_0049425007 /DNA_START=209 /DNA_END=409 /DNA_ORIENTATION=-
MRRRRSLAVRALELLPESFASRASSLPVTTGGADQPNRSSSGTGRSSALGGGSEGGVVMPMSAAVVS